MMEDTLPVQDEAVIKSQDTALVGIPAYNEAATIGSVVLTAKKYTDWVVVIDDGSTDSTAEIARNAGAVVLQQGGNTGKGAAIKHAFEYARESGAQQLILLDADWQHDPDEIPDLLRPLESTEADVIIGSRYLDGKGGRTPRYRRVGQIVLDKLLFLGVGVDVTDSQSGYRAFNRKAIEALDVKENGFGIEAEMFTAAADNGLSVEEVPITIEYDVPNPSTSNSVLHGIRVVDYLLDIMRDRHPLLFFGVPGLTLMVLGLALGAWTMSLYDAGNGFHLGKALYGSVMFIVGVLSLYSALIMNMIGNKLDEMN